MAHTINHGKLNLFISLGWIVVSLLLSLELVGDEIRNTFLNVVISFLMVSSPVWVIYTYKWLFDSQNMPSYLVVGYFLVSAFLSIKAISEFDGYYLLIMIPFINLWLTYLLHRQEGRKYNFTAIFRGIEKVGKELENPRNTKDILASDTQSSSSPNTAMRFIVKCFFSFVGVLIAFIMSVLYFQTIKYIESKEHIDHHDGTSIALGVIIFLCPIMLAIWKKVGSIKRCVLGVMIACIAGVASYHLVAFAGTFLATYLFANGFGNLGNVIGVAGFIRWFVALPLGCYVSKITFYSVTTKNL